MKNKLFALAFFCSFSLNVISQVEHTCEVVQLKDRSLPEETILQYIPNESTTMKYVKVNFHFMMKSDSTLNFRPFDDGLGDCSFTAYDYSKKLIDYVNQRLAGNQQMHLPPGNTTAVLERKYRLVLKDINFHYDDNAYTFMNSSPGNLSQTEIAYYSINPTTEINVFFVYDDSPTYKGGGDATMGGNRYVRVKAAWQKYRDYGTMGFWADAWVIIHENGHNFGLFHTMHNDGGTCCNTCDDNCLDTPTIPDILNLGYPDPCPDWGDESSQYSNNIMDYSGLAAITPQQLGIVHYTLANNMVNYLESNYVTTFPESIIEGNQNLLWQNDTVMKINLRIKNGGTLTMKDCRVHIFNTAKIIVEPGGRLIVDGTTITNDCGTMWPGIEVWGNSTLHQQAVHGNYLQGYLELKNGATIENAVCAVALCHPGVSGTSGGIVFADSAFFVNNAKAVHALNYAYQFSNGGGEMAYNSSFRNCTFTLDNDYLGTETFEQHVDLYDISSLEFIGCHFSVDPEAKGVSPWRCAIQADDAGFTATALCEDPNSYMTPQSCPDEYLVRCSFTGFHNAVYAANTGRNARSFTVSDAVFTGNDRGIWAENTGLATIIRNSFALGCGEDCAFGVYALNVENHCIEENDFAPAAGFTGVTYGVGLFDCGGVNDVYRNDFEGLTCGNLAVGVNTAKTQGLPGTVTQGLTYTCNTDTSNTIDFCVLKNATGGGSIRTQQGSTSLPAGNTFDAGGYHFYNDGNDTVDYHYNGTATGQTPNTSKLFRVKRISTISTNPCLSHYSGGPVVKSPEEKAQLELDYRSAQEDIERLEDLYKRRLAAGADGDELAGLAAQIAQRAHDRSIAAGDIARSTLNDTLTDLRELRTWLRNMGDLASDRLTIASLVQTGDFDDAFALAQTLPGTYNLAGDGLADHSNHLRLLSLYRTLHLSGRDIRQMTGDERLTVEDIARAGYPYSGSLATALLECAGLRENDSPFCPELPKASDRGRGETGTEERETSGFKVTATPNPATTQVTMEYILPEGSSRAMLAILNTLGEKMMELGLEGNRGSTVVDLHELPAGVYFFVVTDLNGRTSSGKVVKQ